MKRHPERVPFLLLAHTAGSVLRASEDRDIRAARAQRVDIRQRGVGMPVIGGLPVGEFQQRQGVRDFQVAFQPGGFGRT